MIPPPSAAGVAPASKPPLSTAAIIALVLAILGLCFPPLAILALIFCVIAFLRIRSSSSGLRGTVPAVIGLAAAGLSCTAWLLVVYLVFLPKVQQQVGTLACQARLHKVGQALDHYSEENERFPDTLRQLVEAGLLDPEDCFCPAMKRGPEASYVIVHEYERVRAGDRVSSHGRSQRMMVFPGGQTGWFSDFTVENAALSPPEDPAVAATPGVTVKPVHYERKLWLKAPSVTWTGQAPFDLVAEIQAKLAEASILATLREAEGGDGTLEAALEERKGPLYSNGESGTLISLRISLGAPPSAAPFRISIAVATPTLVEQSTAGQADRFRTETIDRLKRHPSFREIGTLIGAALGLDGPVSAAVKMTLDPDLRGPAGEALQRGPQRAFSPVEQAYLAVGRDDVEACEAFGTAATEPLIQALGLRHLDSPAILLALGRVGDPRAVEPIRALLRSASPSEDVAIAAIEALGSIGDPSARPDLERIAASASDEIAGPAKLALAAIERRSAKK